MTLHATLNALASQFAHDLLRALRAASLDDIIAETSTEHVKSARPQSTKVVGARAKNGKRIRRSPVQLQVLADHIVALVLKHPKGIRAEELKRAMGVAPGNVGAKVFTKPLAVALASKRISKRGNRRATIYAAR